MLKSFVEVLLIVVAIVTLALTVVSHALTHHGYQLPLGWKNPPLSVNQVAVCDRNVGATGFPFTESRPFEGACFSGHNELAYALNNVIYLVGYGWLAAALAAPFVWFAHRSESGRARA